MSNKRPRLSAEDTRARMIDAGIAILDAQGLQPSVEAITMDRIVRQLETPRSSAYNAWTNLHPDLSPQAAYQRDLIMHFIQRGSGTKSTDTLSDEAAKVLERADTLPRTELRKELLRLAGEAHYQTCLNDSSLTICLALLASASTTPDEPLAADILRWSEEAEKRWRTHLTEEIFKPLFGFLGLVPKPEFDTPLVWEQFTTVLNALGAGILPRISTIEPAVLAGIPRPGPDGEPVPWSLFGIGMDALINQFFEEAQEG